MCKCTPNKRTPFCGAKAREKSERKQKIMEIMAAKQDESLRAKTLEELERELAAL